MAKPNFTLPNKPAIKSGSILSYNYTDDFTFVPAPLTFNRDSAATRVNEKGLIEDVGYFGPELVQNGNFEEEGSELVTNGDFSDGLNNWSVVGGTFASVNNGVLNSNNTSNGSWHSQYIGQELSFINGKTYKIKFTARNISGALNLRLTQQAFIIFTQNITSEFVDYTVYYTAQHDGYQLRFFCNDAVGQFEIDNVSVKEVGQNWAFGTGWSMGDGVAICDGSNTGFSSLQQNNITVSGNKYQATVVIEAVNGAIELKGNGVYQRIDTLGVGTHTLTFVADATYFRFLAHPGSTITIDSISLIEVLGDKPRIDYSDSLTEPSLLLEPQSTNLIPYSEDFSDSYWLKFATNLTITPNAIISPTGQTDASKLVSGSTNAQQAIYRNITKSNCTLSVFAKKAEFDTIALKLSGSQVSKFDLSDGTIGYNTNVTPSIESLGNGWYRCSITIDSSSSAYAWIAIDSGNTQGDESSGIYIWGAQLEELSYATSYIPTAGSTATRLGETANNAGDVNVFNSEEGVFYAEIAALADNDISYRSIFISDGTNNNRVGIRFSNIINKIQALSYKDASLQGFGDYILSSSEQFNKIAFKYKASDFALWVNGVEVQADSSGDVYTVGTLNNINFSAIGGQDFYGKIKNLQVFNKTLTDRELEILTIQ